MSDAGGGSEASMSGGGRGAISVGVPGICAAEEPCDSAVSRFDEDDFLFETASAGWSASPNFACN